MVGSRENVTRIPRALITPHQRGCRTLLMSALQNCPEKPQVRKCPPRTRGGAPNLGSIEGPLFPSAPHTRGCSVPDPSQLGHFTVRPAHAGVLRYWVVDTAEDACPPRTRGGAPATSETDTQIRSSAPHTRGCSVLVGVDPGLREVRPAHAGVLRRVGTGGGEHARPPRTRGGAPRMVCTSDSPDRSAPHTRGCSAIHAVGRGGSSCPPRTRGGAPLSFPDGLSGIASAPHTRGCSFSRLRETCPARVRPAHAGVLLASAVYPKALASPPRTRGGAPLLDGWVIEALRSAPHTRGCSVRSALRGHAISVRPAHAGVLRWRRPRGSAGRCPPRTRGGAPCVIVVPAGTLMSAPHTRGCSAESGGFNSALGVRPAHAGVLLDACISRSSRTGPPRTRGGAPFIRLGGRR